MSQWVTHRDGRYFLEPERFLPDRWEDDLEKRLPKFAYFPFGGGQRVCIGSSFAMMEAVLVLAQGSSSASASQWRRVIGSCRMHRCRCDPSKAYTDS